MLAGTVLLVTTIAFLIFHFFFSSPATKEAFAYRYGSERESIYRVVFQRLTGLFLFGVLPAAILLKFFEHPLSFYGLNLKGLGTSLIFTAILTALIIPMNLFAGRKPDNLAKHPQFRIRTWTPRLVGLSAISWIIYLAGYEFMFRGYLFFGVAEEHGFWFATILNVCIYSLVHVPKGYKEAIGAIPLGALMCFIAYRTGSFLAPFLVHSVLALTNEWVAIRASRDLTR
jgi:membrane protease YdiL (CAAX protease family)